MQPTTVSSPLTMLSRYTDGDRVNGTSATAEALLSYLIQEFGDNRSITSVVPLDPAGAAAEPDLLALSPEQAEETQLCASPCLLQLQTA